MANYSGKDGTVAVGAATIAEVISFNVNETLSPIENSELTDEWTTYHSSGGVASGRKSWSGSIECHLDDTDTTGQDLLVIGAEVTLNLYYIGSTSGLQYITGTAFVGSIDSSTAEETTKRSFSFTGNGAPTKGNVA